MIRSLASSTDAAGRLAGFSGDFGTSASEIESASPLAEATEARVDIKVRDTNGQLRTSVDVVVQQAQGDAFASRTGTLITTASSGTGKGLTTSVHFDADSETRRRRRILQGGAPLMNELSVVSVSDFEGNVVVGEMALSRADNGEEEASALSAARLNA